MRALNGEGFPVQEEEKRRWWVGERIDSGRVVAEVLGKEGAGDLDFWGPGEGGGWGLGILGFWRRRKLEAWNLGVLGGASLRVKSLGP